MFRNKKKEYICKPNNKDFKLCQKERFNLLIEKEKINTVLWRGCPIKTDRRFYLEEEPKVERG